MKRLATAKPILLLLPALFFAGTVPLFVLSSNELFEQIFPILIGLTAAYYLIWPLAVFRCLAQTSLKCTKQKASITFQATVAAIGVVFVFLFGSRIPFEPAASATGIILDLISVTFMFFWYYIYGRLCWAAAVALLFVEGKSNISSSDTFGTFILFLFWPLGSFFLHKRIVGSQIIRQEI